MIGKDNFKSVEIGKGVALVLYHNICNRWHKMQYKYCTKIINSWYALLAASHIRFIYNIQLQL